jgi:hypothetical protein
MLHPCDEYNIVVAVGEIMVQYFINVLQAPEQMRDGLDFVVRDSTSKSGAVVLE